jgi:hypothetical protein
MTPIFVFVLLKEAVNSQVYIGSALFWDLTQRRMVFPYRRFRTTYRSHLQEGPFKTVPIGYPETSVRKHHSMLRKIPEERRSRASRRKPEITQVYIAYIYILYRRGILKAEENQTTRGTVPLCPAQANMLLNPGIPGARPATNITGPNTAAPIYVKTE